MDKFTSCDKRPPDRVVIAQAIAILKGHLAEISRLITALEANPKYRIR